jgi:hypothetical protein
MERHLLLSSIQDWTDMHVDVFRSVAMKAHAPLFFKLAAVPFLINPENAEAKLAALQRELEVNPYFAVPATWISGHINLCQATELTKITDFRRKIEECNHSTLAFKQANRRLRRTTSFEDRVAKRNSNTRPPITETENLKTINKRNSLC